ncbi:uncharacterized protein LOC124159337 [Ischnura elegans]|uniref:uncharacterized protein LOC124159337 n=1 Tax=Ischnura elegans TaxID=197161 RepID=UPI001ED89C41|nr:uncharacterized protein LOC124159337 [Ischnura elegans]
MEDGNADGVVTSTDKDDAVEVADISNVRISSPVCEKNINLKNEEETVKPVDSENIMGPEALEKLKISDQDENHSEKSECLDGDSKNEDVESLSLKPTELNGELDVSEVTPSEELQNDGGLQSSLPSNDGEYSGCDIVRRSIRNRKSTDNTVTLTVKQHKSSKESAGKKAKKSISIVGTNNETNKKMTAQVESSKIGVIGGMRARKKAQRKRDRKPGCTLRMVGSSRAETSSRPLTVAAPLTCTEYLQCLGLQPAVKFKCHKCGETNFASVGMLREHQVACPGVVGGVTSEEAAACATLATSGSNLHITQKLILCSACDTYFESWDLFLHMQSVHRRHICLFCLAMFSRAERLAVHLGSSHGATESSHSSADAFRSSRQSPCLLVCCTCEQIFSDGDDFFDHSCHSGEFPSASGESNGNITGGGNGEGQDSFPEQRQLGDNVGHNNEFSSGASALDCSRVSNSKQASDADGDCNINNAANLCQVHIRVAAKKSLKRKDNVLVVIFEKDDPDGEQFMMRVESKDSLESTPEENEADTSDVIASVIKNSSEDSLSCESNVKDSVDETLSVEKDESEQLPQQSSVPEAKQLEEPTVEMSEHISNRESKQKSETEESSSDESDRVEDLAKIERLDKTDDLEVTEDLDKGEDVGKTEDVVETDVVKTEELDKMEENVSKSPEGVMDQSTTNDDENLGDADAEMESDEEDRDINMDLTLSDASDESQTGAREEPLATEESEEKPEITQNALEDVSNQPVGIEENTPHADSCNLNGNDYSSDSPKSSANESNEEALPAEEEKREDVLSPTFDDDKDAEVDKPETSVQVDEPEVSSQNGIKNSPEETHESTIFNDLPDDSSGIQLAGEEVSVTIIPLEKNMDCYRIQDLLKEAVKVACFSCVYCTHAKKIAVNGKQLALHLLAEHRFQPEVYPSVKKDNYDDDRLCVSEMYQGGTERISSGSDMPEGSNLIKSDVSETQVDRLAASKFVEILKNSLNVLDKSCFNCDSYDNADTSSSHVFSKTYECFQCRFSTGLHKELYIHNRKMHQKTNLLCIMCKCNFYSYSELLCHLCPGVYVPNERPNFRCCFCSADNLPSAFRFMVHLRKRHHACDVCLEVTGDQQRLSGHVWKHKLNHLCYRCDIAYRNKPDITKHLFWKHGTESVLCKRCLQKKWPHVYHFCVPPAIFTCEECSSTFSRAVALRVHRRLHLGEAPHACPECGQHFISKRLVVRHQELKHGDPNTKPVEDNLSDNENVAVDSRASPNDRYHGSHSNNKIKSRKDNLHGKNNRMEGSTNEEDKGITSKDRSSPLKQDSAEDAPNKESTGGADKVDDSILGKDQKPIKKVVDVMDLPPLNLSSESDDSDDEVPPSQQNAPGGSQQTGEPCDDVEKQDVSASSPVHEDEVKPVEFVDGIWDNFKTYTANLEEPKNAGESSSESAKRALQAEDIGLMARIIKAEHDYCFYQDPTEETKKPGEEQEDLKESKNVDEVNNQEPDDGFDHNYCSNTAEGRKSAEIDTNPSEMQESSPKKHPKSPKKRKKAGSGSSSSDTSDSSDSDSSSCSCGTNCSCSSPSSSSGSSSSGSDSDSSVTSGRGANRSARRDKRKEGKRRRHMGNNSRQDDKAASGGDGGIHSPSSAHEGGARVDTIIAKEETPPLREVMIRESDLETDESETDEDFYDEQPRKFHNNAAAALALASRIPPGNSPSAATIEDVSLPSPATSVQSPASRPASPTTSRQWQPALTQPPITQPTLTQPTIAPLLPMAATPPPPPPPAPPALVPAAIPPVIPLAPSPPQPEIRNPLDNISEGFTPLIQPKKRGRKRKRPHLISKVGRKQADNDRFLSDQIRTPTPKMSKAARRMRVESVQQPYKLTPPVQVHNIHNSAGALLNSSVIHSTSAPTTPTSVMEGDDGLRLSKRKRVPKRFYGDSSDEENEGGSGAASSGSIPASSGGGKLTIVLNQSGKFPKRKKSSVGPGSSIAYVAEPASRASMDGMSSLHHSVYQSRAEVENQDVDTSSEREENESQNGRSEGDSEDWSGDEEQSEGPSCPLPSASLRTTGQVPGDSVGGANTGSLYCYCQCPYDEVSEMIACDGKKCAIEWFHFECVGIMVPPKGKWYCPDCRKRCGSSGRTTDHMSGT